MSECNFDMRILIIESFENDGVGTLTIASMMTDFGFLAVNLNPRSRAPATKAPSSGEAAWYLIPPFSSISGMTVWHVASSDKKWSIAGAVSCPLARFDLRAL